MSHEKVGSSCPHAGRDHRAFEKFICWIQRKLIFYSDIEPISLIVAFPPYVVVNIPLPWTEKTKWGVHKVLHLRASIFRYDFNAKAYIPFEFAVKTMERALLY